MKSSPGPSARLAAACMLLYPDGVPIGDKARSHVNTIAENRIRTEDEGLDQVPGRPGAARRAPG
ncbi:hypothetical protein [Tabrizicola sp. YIM 78059]|uniref:hypothetical protein n=1 Tax=Tabrizicola sp. YIM 78059 TaxID=2529861 RepID=UPI0010AA5CD4|nr:hypothetical protein [Tabrizicola sp. YIM 78059]